MTNDEIPNDERMTKHEARMTKTVRRGVLGPEPGPMTVESRRSSFGLWVSFVIGYFVIRHF